MLYIRLKPPLSSNWKFAPYDQHLPTSLSPRPWCGDTTTILLSVLWDFFEFGHFSLYIGDTSCNHEVLDCLTFSNLSHLAYCTQWPSLLLQMAECPYFRCMKTVSLCVCIYTLTVKYTHTHTIFFIHFSIDGHLGCVYILAIVHNAAVNVGVHLSH